MDFKVLCVGDVVGEPGLDRLNRSLRYLKRKTGADFVIVNGENASGVGMTPRQGEEILDDGADCITMGNHTFNQRSIISYLDDCPQRSVRKFGLDARIFCLVLPLRGRIAEDSDPY